MAYFQDKIDWKRQRKRENKNYRSIPFQPNGQRKFQKDRKKIHKIRKIPLLNHFKPRQVGEG